MKHNLQLTDSFQDDAVVVRARLSAVTLALALLSAITLELALLSAVTLELALLSAITLELALLSAVTLELAKRVSRAQHNLKYRSWVLDKNL